MELQTLSSLFLSSTPVTATSWWIQKSWRWVQHQRERWLTMWFCRSGPHQLRISCFGCALPLNQTMCLHISTNGSTSFSATNRQVLQPLLLTTSSTIWPIMKMSTLIALFLAYNELHFKFKFHNLAKYLYSYSMIVILFERRVFCLWRWVLEYRTKKFLMRSCQLWARKTSVCRNNYNVSVIVSARN